MEAAYCRTTGSEFRSTLQEFDADPAVEGLLVLATPDDAFTPATIDETLRELSTPVFGGLFPNVIHEGEAHADGAIVAGLAVRPAVETITDADEPISTGGESITTDADPIATSGDGDYETAFVFVDAFADDGDRFVRQLFNAYGVEYTYIGGGAGTLDGDTRHCLFTNDGLVGDAAVVARITAGSTIGVEHGWTDIGGPFEITAADGRRLETLDGQPAYDRYAAIIDAETDRTVTKTNFFEVAKSHPFGISRLDAERIVRDPFEVDDDGSLRCFGALPEGEFVHVLQGDTESLVAAADRAHAAASEGASTDSALITFDCVSRAQYLESAFDRELAALSQRGSTIGALTIGEVANDGRGHLEYYNKTAVVGAIEGL